MTAFTVQKQTDRPSHRNLRLNLWFSILPLILAAASACLLIPIFLGQQEIEFEDAALIPGAKSLFASIDGAPIHSSNFNEAVLEASRRRGLSKRTLWLGNSQVHAINHYEPGQENAPSILFRHLAPKGVDLITLSPANASLQEHYVIFEYLRSRIQIDYLILSVVFDDTREDSIRAKISIAFKDKQAAPLLSQTELGRKLLENYDKGTYGDKDLAGLKMTLQEKMEMFLNNWLQNHWPIWQLRPQARGRFFFRLYCLRNYIFRISAQSKRPKIPGRYINNIKALETILRIASKAGIEVLVYIVPIRDDVEVPYIQDEYTQFKEEVEQLADAHHAKFENYESLIPAKLWGMKKSTIGNEQMELDFMHFQTKGHKILADELAKFFDKHFLTSLHQVTGEW